MSDSFCLYLYESFKKVTYFYKYFYFKTNIIKLSIMKKNLLSVFFALVVFSTAFAQVPA